MDENQTPPVGGGPTGEPPSPPPPPTGEGGPAAPGEKCVTCGNTASGGNCVACGQGEVTCTCQPATGGGPGPTMGGDQPPGAPAV